MTRAATPLATLGGSTPMRLPTHTQYDSLRDYEDCRLSYRPGGHLKSLVARGWLMHARDGFYRITPMGLAALYAYRRRWGVKP